MHVSLLTTTADRPQAMAICERWVRRMIDRATEHNPQIRIEWIVSDGGRQPAPVREDLCVRYIRNHSGGSPACNFRRNLLAGLRACRGDFVLFIEDDDWYAAEWICSQLHWLRNHDIAGEARAKYYNLQTRRYHVHRNTQHASLCQTGIRRAVIPALTDLIQRSRDAFIDIPLWRTLATSARAFLAPQSTQCIGLKGLPGKSGIGIGHRLQTRTIDHKGRLLREWIGEDALVYEQLRFQTA